MDCVRSFRPSACSQPSCLIWMTHVRADEAQSRAPVHFCGCSCRPAFSAWPRCAHSFCCSGVIWVGVSPAGTELHRIVSSNPGAEKTKVSAIGSVPVFFPLIHVLAGMNTSLRHAARAPDRRATRARFHSGSAGFHLEASVCASVASLPAQAVPSPPRDAESRCSSGSP